VPYMWCIGTSGVLARQLASPYLARGSNPQSLPPL